MLVTDDAKYCSRRSKVDLAAMSDRGDQKEVSKEEPTSVTSRAKQPVIKNSFDKKGQSSKAVRRRAYPTDAATAPVSLMRKRKLFGVEHIPLTRLPVPHLLSLMRKKVWRASEGRHR